MFLAWLTASLILLNGECHLLTSAQQDEDQKLAQCVVDILNKYFSEHFDITYVDIHTAGNDLMKAIHSTTNFTLISRNSTQQMFVPNIGYLISSANVSDFLKYFCYLIQEPEWNPYVRFLIVIKILKNSELKLIFNELLKQHVNNVLLVNGTEDAHLYTYNPFDNYACGKYYDHVINYGLCSQATNNLYPNKLISGLNNCHFRALVAHRPPLSLDPSLIGGKKALLGTEEYVLALLAQKENFTVSYNYSYDALFYSTITTNMTAIGPMKMLQTNECDITFGEIYVYRSRATAFSYLIGHLDYKFELLFAVKKASLVPTWKYLYLEFGIEVWALLLVTLFVYTVIIVKLNSEDISQVVLRLLENLVGQGPTIHTCVSMKYILISWMWGTYLINTFYLSSLFSFTTHPSMEYQVSDEQDFIKYGFKPCVPRQDKDFDNILSSYFGKDISRCKTVEEILNAVVTKKAFTIVPSNFYQYYIKYYSNEWGDTILYSFQKPYTKIILGFFFYKGFPISSRIQLNALRIKESGLVEKNLHDHYYQQRLKLRYSQQPSELQFVLPWCVFIPGLVTATLSFILELLTERRNRIRCRDIV